MKHIIRYTAVALAVMSLSSCLEEYYPTTGMTQEQVNQTSSSLTALNQAIASSMLSIGYGYGFVGYVGVMLNSDVACADLPIHDATYDYFYNFAGDTYLSDNMTQAYDHWSFYYNLVNKCNLTLKAADAFESLSDEQKRCAGNAHAYRAFAYFDMARHYEYKHTGVESLDQQAQADSLYGLTVPIVTQNTTEEEDRNNPRAPFWKLYRFILTDLNAAEQLLDGQTRSSSNQANSAVVYGLKARFYIELGARFRLYPGDLNTVQQHEGDEADLDKLGVTSSADCYKLAADYARRAINEGYSPLTKDQWFNATTGFNTENQAWLWAMKIARDDIADNDTWQNFTGFMSPEADFGVANATYGAERMIDASLFKSISTKDWRRATWISTTDAGRQVKYKNYSTLLTAREFAELPAYTGLKFHVGSGNRTDAPTGAAVDIPLMRVEEMYLIEAEAIAHTQGLEAGKTALQDFVNTYRYTDGSYTVGATSLDDFDSEILRQKRIEFWGEGIVFGDYKRLEKQVVRDYTGTNHLESFRFNSRAGYVPPRFNLPIYITEKQYNLGIKNNPDPSGLH